MIREGNLTTLRVDLHTKINVYDPKGVSLVIVDENVENTWVYDNLKTVNIETDLRERLLKKPNHKLVVRIELPEKEYKMKTIELNNLLFRDNLKVIVFLGKDIEKTLIITKITKVEVNCDIIAKVYNPTLVELLLEFEDKLVV